MRHRFAIQDVAFAIGVILLIGLGAYEFSFMGSVEENKRIEFEEMVIFGGVVITSILYLGWRRVRDQEREIQRRMAAEHRAHELAHTDPLTGLANRRELENEVRASLNALPGSEEIHAVFMLDLNGFKKINDVYGHPEGDEVLVTVAERLKIATRDRDLVARPGGDEFSVVARHLSGPEGATNIAARILKEFEPVVRTTSHTHRIGVGIGIALVPRDGKTSEEILRKADIALYRAKREPYSALRFFDEDMDRQVQERDSMERELAAAIGKPSLRPWYQPIVDLKTNEIVEFEALARWYHPSFGEVLPERFIPIAESAGLIREVGDWLLRCAATDAATWPNHVALSFNISPIQLKDKTLGLRILKILEETGLRPDRLEIEITESAIVHDLENAKETLSHLRAAGIRIALDDFGTGYSSLYHLRNLKIDKIKIDRSFVHAMGTETESAAIVNALTGLGKGLGLIVTAEGVEENAEREQLLQQGCQQGQGFLFSKAMSADKIAALFEKNIQTVA